MEKAKYETVEDFVLDESFQEYVTGYPQASVDFWSQWIIKNPEQTAEIQGAKSMLITLSYAQKSTITVDKQEALQLLLSKIKSERNETRHAFNVPVWLKVAALVLVTAGLTWFANLYYLQQQDLGEALTYNEIIVPIGEKSQVILADGTHVWINSGSHFKYPTLFNKQSREVFVRGEAFFDVTHQEDKPFTVFTKDSEIKVLGTAFNVKSYPDDDRTLTTVVRGLVSVQSLHHKTPAVLVRPNQAIEMKLDSVTSPSSSQTFQVLDHVNVVASTSWKDQLLVFEDEPLEDMIVKMERWFNVSIVIADNTLKKERYNGKFVNNENVYQVLEAIKFTTPIKYKVKGNEIVISRK